MTIHTAKDYIATLYPMRKTTHQKEEFRKWLLSEMKKAGWRAREEACGKTNGSVNVVAGDPDNAAVFLCAHYDTAARMILPDFECPTNVLAYTLYHIASAFILIAAAFLVALAISFPLHMPSLMVPLFMIFLLAELGITTFGPANKNNANNNTSGILALLEAAQTIKYDKRVCFVFFDNNERNTLGARGFKKCHPNAADGLFINLDCVGDGEHLLLMPSKYSRWDGTLLEALETGFQKEKAMEPHLLTKGLHYYPSDHRKFRFHVAVCACHHLTGLGYYISRLHTGRDTELSLDAITYIANGLDAFLTAYWSGQAEEGKTS